MSSTALSPTHNFLFWLLFLPCVVSWQYAATIVQNKDYTMHEFDIQATALHFWDRSDRYCHSVLAPPIPSSFFCSNLSLHTCKCTTRPNIKNIFLSGIFFGHAFKWLSGAFRSPCCQITTHYSGSKQGYINLIHHQNLFLFLC